MSDVGKKIRNSFFAGLLVVVPVAVSVGILWWLFTWFTNFLLPVWLRRVLEDLPYPETLYRLIALGVFVLFVIGVGWVTRLVIGRQMLAVIESWMGRVPLLNKIYGFVKEVSQTLLGQRKTVFERVVMLEYPRPGIYAIAFVTNEAEGEVQARTQQRVINVFLPTTPNPTSGFLLIVPADQLIDLKMSVADAMKLVISGGSVAPPYPLPVRQPALVAPPPAE
jgi:uncharacterized membrane protein